MTNFMLIASILYCIILLSILNIVFALKCPNCRRWFALVSQEHHQRCICKYCAWLVYDNEWVPPDKGAIKILHDFAPFKYKKGGEDP
jgi:hypothetical protein